MMIAAGEFTNVFPADLPSLAAPIGPLPNEGWSVCAVYTCGSLSCHPVLCFCRTGQRLPPYGATAVFTFPAAQLSFGSLFLPHCPFPAANQ